MESRALTSDIVEELEGPPGGDPDEDAPPGLEPQAKTASVSSKVQLKDRPWV
jgi:hypothetical protein